MTQVITPAPLTHPRGARPHRAIRRARPPVVAIAGALAFCTALADGRPVRAQTMALNAIPSARAGGDAYIAIAHLRAKPERLGDFVAAVRALRARTIAEPGAVPYDLLQDPDDHTRYTVVEVYRDKAAFDAHVATPYVRAFFAEAPRYLAERGTGEFFAARRDGELPIVSK